MVFPTLCQLLYEIWNDNKGGNKVLSLEASAHTCTELFYMLADANTSGSLGEGFQMKSSGQSALQYFMWENHAL